MAGTPSSATSRALLEGTHCKAAGTQQRLYGPVSHETGNKRIPELQEYWNIPNAGSQNKWSHSRGEECGSSELCTSAVGVDTGLSDHLQESIHRAPLIPHVVVSCEHNKEASEDHGKLDGEVVDVFKHTATQSSKCHATTSTVTKPGLGLTSHSLQSSQYRPKKTDTKVSDWLAHGILDSSPAEAGFLARNSKDSDRSFALRHIPLSPFPPKSPLGDVREYMPRNGLFINSAYPASPLNNGRDAYGNHIPSNANDYLITHSQPSLLKPLAKKDEKTPSIEKPSTAEHLYDCRWDRFKSFWKATDTQASNQQTNPGYPHIIPDTDEIPRDVPEVMYSGRVGNHGFHNINSPFPTAYPRLDSRANNVKGNCSTPDLRQYRVPDAASSLEGPDLIGVGDTVKSKNRFNAACNHENTFSDGKKWQNGSLLLPKRSLQAERNEYDMFAHSTRGKIANMMRNGSPNTYLKAGRERRMQPIEKKKQSHGDMDCSTEGQLTCQHMTQKQNQSIMCEDANNVAITPLPAKKPFKLERMLDFGVQLPRNSTSSSRNILLQDPVLVSAQDSKKQKKNIATPEHVTPVPASVPAMSLPSEKPQPLLRTMLSKAGDISRSILTASFHPKSKASSQRQPSTDSSKACPPKASMSAYRTGWPRASPPNTQGEANTLAGHYQVLTAGAFDDLPPSHHSRHESLASVTNEALVIADQLLQRDVQRSTDQVRSSFSFDSASEIETNHQKDKEKEEKTKNGEIARAMAWMGMYM